MTNRTLKYIYVKNMIKDSIQNRTISDKLPGERVLASQLNVSYMTVRKAIAELVEEGILYKEATKGTFVSHKKINSKVTGNIGFLLDDEIDEGISSPYYSLVFKSLEEEITRSGYNLLFFTDFDALNPLKTQKKIDGVVICCFPRIEDRIQEIKPYLPIVLLDNVSSDKSIPSVTIDNFHSCSQSVQYLISLGHRRIGFISGLLDSDICIDRLFGYTSALQRAGLDEDKTLVFKGDYSYDSGQRAAEYFICLPNPPTAIMCANDSMAMGAMKVIQESGLSIPDDISIIGFDDIMVAARVFPALSTNAAPIAAIAKTAIEILLDEINGINADYKHVVLQAELIKRDSCAPIIS
jgi:DNA-binding LacI/PurR family transcriptional regulator